MMISRPSAEQARKQLFPDAPKVKRGEQEKRWEGEERGRRGSYVTEREGYKIVISTKAIYTSTTREVNGKRNTTRP
jgi:hypothetical protein